MNKTFLKEKMYESMELDNRKKKKLKEDRADRKLFKEFKILVDGRVYEVSHTPQRRDEIIQILQQMYPDSEIEVVPYNHYESGAARKELERIISKQLQEYGVNESLKKSKDSEDELYKKIVGYVKKYDSGELDIDETAKQILDFWEKSSKDSLNKDVDNAIKKTVHKKKNESLSLKEDTKSALDLYCDDISNEELNGYGRISSLTDAQVKTLLSIAKAVSNKYKVKSLISLPYNTRKDLQNWTKAATQSGVDSKVFNDYAKNVMYAYDELNESLALKEDWTHFEFTSGSNPYIATTEKEKNRMLKKYKGRIQEVKPGFYKVNDKNLKESLPKSNVSLSDISEAILDVWDDDSLSSTLKSTADYLQYFETTYGWKNIDLQMFNDAWEMAASNSNQDDEVNGHITTCDGGIIDNQDDAVDWLESKLNTYGSTYFFPECDKITLDKLVGMFGSTYFWR